MPRYTPTRNTFETRLVYLAQERGIDRLAQDYGRSRETVRRWIRGVQSPPVNIQRSVVRRGRRLTGPVERSRDSRGRFRTRLRDPRGAAAVRSIEAGRAARYRAMEEAATNERQRRMARQERVETEMTEDEKRDLERRFGDVTRDDVLGRDTRQKWADLREDYARLMGRS